MLRDASAKDSIKLIHSIKNRSLLSDYGMYKIYYYEGISNLLDTLKSYLSSSKQVIIPQTIAGLFEAEPHSIILTKRIKERIYDELLHAFSQDIISAIKKKTKHMSYRSRIRSNSGVFPLPIFTKPHSCGGSCIFCPKQNGIPNSYIENEDTLFAKACSYSPIAQFKRFSKRIRIPNVSSCIPTEIIILGGSFSSHKKEYRKKFLNDLYASMLGLKECNVLNNAVTHPQYIPSVVTVESRPDQINTSECIFLRELGISKVEIGVQHTSNTVLHFNRRGHGQSAIIEATRLLKEEGFKVGYHIMLGLPNATQKDDIKMLTATLWKTEYSPDYLKIYPCVLLKNPVFQPKLFHLYKSEKWFPISNNDVTFLLRALSKSIPSYVRISRIQRQFNPKTILRGVSPGVRIKSGVTFLDIRSREVGHVFPDIDLAQINAVMENVTFRLNDVYFELLTNEKILLGMARVRIRDDFLIICELKIYGKAAPVGCRGLIQGNGLRKGCCVMLKSLDTNWD
ncbi:MAG: radical SAM protein [Deltaproteobacteria bacterium]|nr:radical SAM protein [Deltaproteobacteria bacterium]